MKISEAIRKRRSVRTFDGTKLRAEDALAIKEFAEKVENPYDMPITWKLLDAAKYGLSSPVIVGTDDYIAGKMRRAPHAEEAFGYAFEKVGLFLFTMRNGNPKDPSCQKTYAEKYLISKENQDSPMHFHWHKMEDIINRGGGHLMMRVYNCAPDESMADTPVTVHIDGREMTVPAGTVLRLLPGESLSIPPYLYHEFWAEEGFAPCLIGEVSMVNDDNTDNRFYEPQGRFPTIEEDEPPLYLLCNEYPSAP